jgi:hypothetical protein
MVIHMTNIPVMLECAYCRRSCSHGGECERRNNNQGCLYFKLDPRGCIRREEIKIPFNLFEDIPPLDTWESGRWTIYGNETDIKINRIKALKWDQKRGLIYVYADCSYFINEFSDEYKKEQNKPKLKIIK